MFQKSFEIVGTVEQIKQKRFKQKCLSLKIFVENNAICTIVWFLSFGVGVEYAVDQLENVERLLWPINYRQRGFKIACLYFIVFWYDL